MTTRRDFLVLWMMIASVAGTLATAYATSFAEPVNRSILSPGGKFELHITAKSGLHQVRKAGGLRKTLWRFSRRVWHDDYFLSPDGTRAAWVSWQFTTVESLENPAVIIYDAKGEFAKFSFRQLGPSRRYRKGEVGPIGDTMRIWRESSVTQTGDRIHIVTPTRRVTINLLTGMLENAG